jgi:hypothetical protein
MKDKDSVRDIFTPLIGACVDMSYVGLTSGNKDGDRLRSRRQSEESAV